MLKGDNQLWPVNRLALSKLSGRKIQMIKTYKNCMNVVHYILSSDSFSTYAKLRILIIKRRHLKFFEISTLFFLLQPHF